ncbi:MAG: ribonuclease PH [Candidatus Eisenbacteria bacterium]|nr:ribonuclease PH [Candidatus Eisenbacteria bacterium]
MKIPGRRLDGRRAGDLRKIKIKVGVLRHAEGSCLIEMGNTRVMCSATLENKVPYFLKAKGHGWVTAEYGMLPRSSHERIQRESVKGKVSGRTQEIQRLIGRSLRAVTELDALGERTILLDCDVLEADGGTRTASITGAFVALHEAFKFMVNKKLIKYIPVRDFVAAISVGKVKGEFLLDLNYAEDSTAQVDMNVVMTGSGHFVEVQGTAEGLPFRWEEMNAMLKLGSSGIQKLIKAQKKSLGLPGQSKGKALSV